MQNFPIEAMLPVKSSQSRRVFSYYFTKSVWKMKNIYFSTANYNYIILEVDHNQKLISDLSLSIKTEGKLEEILLKTYFKDLKYQYIGQINESIINDYNIGNKEKLQSILEENNIVLNTQKKYYLFKEITIPK